MRRRVIATMVALAAGGIAAGPAGAHGGGEHGASRAHYPGLPGRAGSQARAVERRERAIETASLGDDHALEHAQGRALVRGLRDSTGRRANALGAWTDELQPVNTLVPPNVGGRWEQSVQLPIVAINAIMLHTGKILYFAYPWRATELDPATGTPGTPTDWDTATAYLYDPATGASRQMPPPVNPDTGKRVELFCAGASLLADGRVLVTGGNVGDPSGDKLANKANYGLNTIYTFDPEKAERGLQPWTEGPRMAQGRWYPTQTLLPDGRTVLSSGQSNKGDDPDNAGLNADIELYTPDTAAGVVEPFGRYGGADRPGTPGQYPHQWWMPSGTLLNAGPFKADFFVMDRPPAPKAGAANSVTFKRRGTLRGNQEWAGGVLSPVGVGGDAKVMLLGGADRTDADPQPVSPALATTTYYDEANPNLGWRQGAPLNFARAFANAVLMPTGKVAVVGGGAGEDSKQRYYRWISTAVQRRVEIADPADPTAAPVAGNQQAEGRAYHSTALLLPDARVWSAGDDINGPLGNPTAADPQGYSGGATFEAAQRMGAGSGVCTDTAEVWTPPYLLNADGSLRTRPVIAGTPRSATYGTTIGVRTSASARKAVLVAPGAATHANDMSQRVVTLDATRVAGRGLNVTLPASADVAPPSWYMLFVLDATGTPSVSRFVRLVPPGVAVDAPGALTAGSRETDTPKADADPVPTAAPAGQRTGCDGTGNPPPTPVPDPAPDPDVSGTAGAVESQLPVMVPTPGATEPFKARFRAGARLALPSTLARLRTRKRFSLVVTTTRPARLEVRTSIRLRATAGKRKGRLVPLAIARTVRAKTGRKGAVRVRVKLTRGGMRRLRAVSSARLVVTVKAKPAKGKAVTVKRRPVLR